MSTPTPSTRTTRESRSLLIDALIGAVVTVVTTFLPLSPIVGGAVAGYLHREDGLAVGGLSGAIAAIPIAGLLLLAGLAFAFVPDPTVAGGIVLVVSLIVLAGLLYGAVLGALGGYVGVYLSREFGGGSTDRR